MMKTAKQESTHEHEPTVVGLQLGPIEQATPFNSWAGLVTRLVIPVAILGVGIYAYSILAVSPGEEKGDAATPQLLRTRVVPISAQDYTVTIHTHGTIQSHNEVTLSSEVTGRIMQLNPAFEVGSYFKAGEVLVELDPRDYATAVAISEAQQMSAKSALDLAIQNHERNIKLHEKNVVSEAEVSLAAANRQQAAAQLNSAIAQLDQSRHDLERTTIRAPFDGRVRRMTVGLGQTVGVGAPLGVIFAVDFAEVRLPISGPELQFLDLPEMEGDAPVEVELRDGISETVETIWKANIVRTEGALDATTFELFAIARIDDPFGLQSHRPPLRIGQPVKASIAGKSLYDVVALPREAVRQMDQIYLIDKTEHTLTTLKIESLWSDDQHVIVRRDSLADNSLLATTQLVYAPNGAKVEIIPEVDITTSQASSSGESDSVAN